MRSVSASRCSDTVTSIQLRGVPAPHLPRSRWRFRPRSLHRGGPQQHPRQRRARRLHPGWRQRGQAGERDQRQAGEELRFQGLRGLETLETFATPNRQPEKQPACHSSQRFDRIPNAGSPAPRPSAPRNAPAPARPPPRWESGCRHTGVTAPPRRPRPSAAALRHSLHSPCGHCTRSLTAVAAPMPKCRKPRWPLAWPTNTRTSEPSGAVTVGSAGRLRVAKLLILAGTLSQSPPP